MRQRILDAIRKDLSEVIKGANFKHTIVKVHKKLLNMKDVRDFPSAYIHPFRERGVRLEHNFSWTFPVGIVIYFEVKKDVDNEGLVEKMSEELIQDQKTLWQGYGNLARLKGVEGLEMPTIEPYIDTEQRQGYIFLILQFTYIGD